MDHGRISQVHRKNLSVREKKYLETLFDISEATQTNGFEVTSGERELLQMPDLIVRGNAYTAGNFILVNIKNRDDIVFCSSQILRGTLPGPLESIEFQ